MKMLEVQAGLGWEQEIRTIFVFETKDAMNHSSTTAGSWRFRLRRRRRRAAKEAPTRERCR